MKEHAHNVSKCHLTNVSLVVDPSLRQITLHQPCERCEVVDDTPSTGQQLVCDGCATTWHLRCCEPPLASVPEGRWFCNYCRALHRCPPGVDRRGVLPRQQPSQPRRSTRESAALIDRVRASLEHTMPGTWPRAHLAALAAALPSHQPSHAACPAAWNPGAVAYGLLVAAIDWDAIEHVLDPCALQGRTRDALSGHQVSVLACDPFPDPTYQCPQCNLLTDRQDFERAHGWLLPVSAVVTAPYQALLDLYTPSLAALPRYFAAIYVPVDFLTPSSPPPRLSYFQDLFHQGRLACCIQLDQNHHPQHMWVIIFRTARHMRQFWRLPSWFTIHAAPA